MNTITRPNVNKYAASFAYLAALPTMPAIRPMNTEKYSPSGNYMPQGPMIQPDNAHMPITTFYNGKLTRYVKYRAVKIITLRIKDTKYNVGELWGIQYGRIRLNGELRIVTRKMQNSGFWSSWELI